MILSSKGRTLTTADCCSLFGLQIDLRLISILGALYLLSHIDRGNIGNAKIEGMDKDIGLTSNQYNIASTIFFVPYILFGENCVVKRGPRISRLTCIQRSHRT